MEGRGPTLPSLTPPSARHQLSGSVLDQLEVVHQFMSDAVVHHVARIQSSDNECQDHCLRGHVFSTVRCLMAVHWTFLLMFEQMGQSISSSFTLLQYIY